MIVRKFIKYGEPLTAEQIEELKNLEEMPDEDIVFDEEFPRLTAKELSEFKRVNPLPEVRQVANG